MDAEIAETGTRPDLVWDNEMPGLCVRVYGSGKKSFIFVYRRDNQQRFIRIGTTPRWSLEGARRWAKELRSAIDRDHDPELYNHERQKIKPVESFIQLIGETQQSEFLSQDEARGITCGAPVSRHTRARQSER